MRLYDYLDLRFQELRNAVSQNLPEPPENPVEGLFYYNNVAKRWYIYDGEKWIDCTLQLIDFSCSITGITYNQETGEFSLDEGYVIPTLQQFQDLWDAIGAEETARINADTILQQNIDAEELARINADNILQSNIDAEEQARINSDNILTTFIEDINKLIPAQASVSNKLADKNYVMNNVYTYSTNFRGNWPTWASVPTNPNLYPVDVSGNKTPTQNDILVVMSDEHKDRGTWVYAYRGTWSTDKKNGWIALYELSRLSLTPEQQEAVDSGINAELVEQITTNENDILGIQELIPNQASVDNKLADKNFVNSSIATNTAYFIGTFENESALESYEGTVTNNDYAFVINSVVTDNEGDWADFETLDAYDKTHLTNLDYAWVVNGVKFDLYSFDIINQEWVSVATNIAKDTSLLNTAYNRYKASVSDNIIGWDYEYTLNNSSFTANQWASINSGVTSSDVDLIRTAVQPNDLASVATTGDYDDLINKPASPTYDSENEMLIL